MRAAEQLEARADAMDAVHPGSAAAWLERVWHALDQLVRFPLRGRRVPEYLEEPVREVIVRPCRIIYQPSEHQVQILTVKHSREELFPDDVHPDYP